MTSSPRVERVDITRQLFDIHRDLSITTRAPRPGPPQRIDGMTVGIVDVVRDAPHNGEVHPDGDEILVVLSGRMRVEYDSAPDAPLELGPGEACIVRRGEWHCVRVVEPGRGRARVFHRGGRQPHLLRGLPLR